MTALAAFGILAVGAALCPHDARAQAKTCTEAEIVAAQEAGSGALRRLNAQTTPLIDTKLRELQKQRGWSDHDLDDKMYDQLEDDTIRAFDRETATLITRMESLSEPTSALPACERLVEMRQTLERLREIAQAKSQHLTAKLDRELRQTVAAVQPGAGSPQSPAPVPKPGAAAQKAPHQIIPPSASETAPPPKAADPRTGAASSWSTTAKVEPGQRREPPHTGASSQTTAMSPSAAPPAAPAWEPPPPMSEPGSYSREEIFAAGQGVFGKVSSGLASVLDFAFQKAGRPSGYIIGDEGGGAFLAGVRYGQGELHLKGRPPQIVYWRGPSIGYDVGAAGSRMMVLVYNVRDPEELFSNFGGVDGSAYFVGGLGVTFLTNGKKAMAPIRSGIGLRFGANIGYLKFSHKPSWNPF